MRGLLRRIVPADAPFYPFKIPYSAKFDGDGARLNKLDFGAADNLKKFTLSAWIKKPALDSHLVVIYGENDDETNYQYCRLTKSGGGSDNVILFYRVISSAGDQDEQTIAKYRDTSHWYHLVIRHDSTEASGSNRLKMYINGVQVGTSHDNYVSTDDGQLFTRPDYTCIIGRRDVDVESDGYKAEYHFLDGIVASVDDFGEFIGGTWVPKEYTGSYGTNGFYLDFADSGDLGKDVSGNGNHFSNVGGNVEQSEDTPTNNFMVLDALDSIGPSVNVTKAGLKAACSSTSDDMSHATVALDSGKWVWEVKFTSMTGTSGKRVGLRDLDGNGVYWEDDGSTSGITGSPSFASFTTNDVLRVEVDFDNTEISFFKNDTLQGTGGYGFTVTAPAIPSQGNNEYVLEFINGSQGFTNTPTAGFKAVCTANMSVPAVADGSKVFWAENFTGDETARDIVGANFDLRRSSLVWLKNREEAYSHQWYDTVRGVGKAIYPNLTNAEATATDALTAFLTNGFSLGDNAYANTSGDNMMALAFNMQPKYGMEIVTYTGTGVARTVPHNLGDEPELILIKDLDDGTRAWIAGHKNMYLPNPWNYYLVLNDTAVPAASITAWNNTPPTSTVFTVGTSTAVNTNGHRYIAYLFRSVPGLVKVGFWTGNGAADGPRVHFGFRPKFLLFKAISGVYNWPVLETDRNPSNPLGYALTASTVNAESYGDVIDVLSNGLKIRTSLASYNQSTKRFAYLAIADMAFPFVNAF